MDSILSDKFNLDELKKLLCIGYSVKYLAEVGEGPVMIYAGKGSKSVALASGVTLAFEESRNEIGGIGDERGRVLENGRYGKHGVLSHVRMAVFKTGPGRGEKGFDELRLPEFAEEAEGVSTNVLVRMLQIVTNAVARVG